MATPPEPTEADASEPDAVPVVTIRDVGVLGLLPALVLVAWLAPERSWPALVWWLAGLRQAFRAGRARREIATLQRLLGDRLDGGSLRACRRSQLANDYHAWLYLLRCHRPGEPAPPVRLVGRGHLEAALGAGRGAILWVAPFAFSDLGTKVALHRAGFGVSHLSRDTHGLSTSRFGRRVLDPIRTRIETRHLAERLVMTETDTVRPLRTLARRLEQNRLVSITVTGTGRQARDLPLLGGRIRIATGAPALAWRSGASLLPVFTLRERGGLVTRVEAPLTVPSGCPRARAVDEVLGRYLPILERHVLRAPEQVPLPYLASSDAAPRIAADGAEPGLLGGPPAVAPGDAQVATGRYDG